MFCYVLLFQEVEKKENPSTNFAHISPQSRKLQTYCHVSFGCWTNGFLYVFKKEQGTIEASIRAVTLRGDFYLKAFLHPLSHLAFSVDIYDDPNWEGYWLLNGKVRDADNHAQNSPGNTYSAPNVGTAKAGKPWSKAR